MVQPATCSQRLGLAHAAGLAADDDAELAPISSACASAGTSTASPCPARLWRGLMYSTGAFGGALCGG